MLHSEKDLDKPYPEVYGLVHSMACFLTFKLAYSILLKGTNLTCTLLPIFLSKLPLAGELFLYHLARLASKKGTGNKSISYPFT